MPALGYRNGGADSGVRTGAKPDGQAFDLFALPLRFTQGGVDQAERFPAMRAGLTGIAKRRNRHRQFSGPLCEIRVRRRCGCRLLSAFQRCRAALLGGKFKRQNLHR